MFERLRHSPLLFWSVELLVVAAFLWIATKINFIFQPIGTFFSTIFTPLLVAGFLYYLLNPLVKGMVKLGMPRLLAIIMVFLFLILLIVLFLGAVLPSLLKQIAQLLAHLPDFLQGLEKWGNEMLQHPYLKNIDLQDSWNKMDISIGPLIKKVLTSFSTSLSSIISSIASVTILVVTVPFILFYMLKDGEKLVPFIESYLPQKHKTEIIELLHKMSDTISSYISGQAIECLFVGLFTFLGYWLVGIDYAFLFGCIAGVTNMIPYLGPYIGLAPAVFVTILDTPLKAFLACVVVLVVQQIDGNIIYPNVIGKSLEIHPLTIIIILLVAGNIAGLVGMILGVPFYAICKTVIKYVYDIIRLRKSNEHLIPPLPEERND